MDGDTTCADVQSSAAERTIRRHRAGYFAEELLHAENQSGKARERRQRVGQLDLLTDLGQSFRAYLPGTPGNGMRFATEPGNIRYLERCTDSLEANFRIGLEGVDQFGEHRIIAGYGFQKPCVGCPRRATDSSAVGRRMVQGW